MVDHYKQVYDKLSEQYDNTQFPLLPLPEEGVALTIDVLVYKEYYATRKSQYLVLFPMREDK